MAQEFNGEKIFVFANQSDNDKAPAFKGMIKTADGQTKLGEVALWYMTDRDTGEQILDDNGNPKLSGKISAPYVKPTS